MGGSNFGRSHEPQQCGGAHLPNTPSLPNAAVEGGIGDRQNTAFPMTHTPKSPLPPQPYHSSTPQHLLSHQNTNSPNDWVRGPGGGAPRPRQRRRRRAAALPRRDRDEHRTAAAAAQGRRSHRGPIHPNSCIPAKAAISTEYRQKKHQWRDRRICEKGGGGMCCGNKSNVWGILLMVLGLFLLVLSLPYWLWMAVLGLALIIIGFILWRFG